MPSGRTAESADRLVRPCLFFRYRGHGSGVEVGPSESDQKLAPTRGAWVMGQPMKAVRSLGRRGAAAGLALALLAAGLAFVVGFPDEAEASWLFGGKRHHAPCAEAGGPECGDWAGAWYWLRSPEQERRVVASLYNLYCRRCHGVDGRGVWDIPDVPDLTNARWQATRTDAQFARAIVEGRGAVMPAFRGTLTLEESWAMARYLRSFIPGVEASRPDVKEPEKSKEEQLPAPTPAGPRQ